MNAEPLPSSPALDLVLAMLRAVEQGATGDVLARFFHADVVQEELPNRLTPRGAVNDLAAMQRGAERGAQVVRSQRYDVKRAVVQGDRIALEMTWTAVLAVPVGALAAGDEMRAHLAMFVDVSDGKISAQRNYDCFEPF
jgi:ketosteroid isomerase-like protein